MTRANRSKGRARRARTAGAGNSPAEAVAIAIGRHGREAQALVQILREVRESLGWLSRPVLAQLAAELGLALAQVEGVAGFYRFLPLHPVGRTRVLFSDNVTDRMAGSVQRMQELCGRLQVAPGAVRGDGAVSVNRCSCTGMCDQGPALLVDYRRVITRLDAQRVGEIADRIDAGVPVDAWPEEWSRVDDNIRRADVLLGRPAPPGEAIARARALGPAGVIEELKRSKLRGRGGAGFATGTKWELCRQAAATERIVVCNADEGEPGTFKDRVLLNRFPDEVFEGMTVAALAIGARRGFLYLRGEYRYLLGHLEAVLERRRRDGLLAASIQGVAGFDFDLQIHVGAGAYVCGEESALIESLEGKRGTPRIRPPFPVQSGYLGLPTIVNNVETFVAAARVLRDGEAAWRRLGTAQSSGTKIHSISGDCERPGIYEFPLGTPVDTLLEACGARDTQAVQVGGPSGSCLSAIDFGRRIAFEDVPTAGAFMVFDRRRDMFAVARNFAHFFAHESCGFCTPCRVGTELVMRRFDKLESGRGSRGDVEVLYELDRLMHVTTHCGLGGAACNNLHDTIAKFRPAYERRLKSLHFEPAFDLDAELAEARRLTGRDDPGAHLESAW